MGKNTRRSDVGDAKKEVFDIAGLSASVKVGAKGFGGNAQVLLEGVRFVCERWISSPGTGDISLHIFEYSKNREPCSYLV